MGRFNMGRFSMGRFEIKRKPATKKAPSNQPVVPKRINHKLKTIRPIKPGQSKCSQIKTGQDRSTPLACASLSSKRSASSRQSSVQRPASSVQYTSTTNGFSHPQAKADSAGN